MTYTRPAAPQPSLPDAVWKTPAPAVGVVPRATLDRASNTAASVQATVAGWEAPLRVIYGERRIGPQVVNYLVHAGKLVMRCIWGYGPIDSINDLYQGDTEPATGIQATHYTGAAGQGIDPTLAVAFAAQGIAYTDTLDGIAYSVIRVAQGDSTGVPAFTARIRGRLLYDPRSDSTAWSDNPALALADFNVDTRYGFARGESAAWWASVEALADINDELLSGQKRRTIGLVIDSVQKTTDWRETLRAHAGCWIVPDGASDLLVPDAPSSPVMDLTATDIQGLRLSRPRASQSPTIIKVRYTDTSVTPNRDGVAIIKAPGIDEGTTPRRISEVSMSGIVTLGHATRAGTERLNAFLLGDLDAEWTASDYGARLRIGDVVRISYGTRLTLKQFRVKSVKPGKPGRWRIQASEYDVAMHSDTVVADPSPVDTALPAPTDPPALTGISAAEEVFQLENGTWSSRLRVTWDEPDYPYVAHYRVEVYRLGELIATATTRTGDYVTASVQEGVEYVIKAAVVTSIGTVSEWAQDNITPAGKYLVPGNVPSVQVFEAGGRVYVSWEPAVDLDIWRYEVRYGPTGGTWDTATQIDRVDALRLTSDQIPVGDWTVYVKALDSVGQYSTSAATATVTVTSDASAFLVDSYESDTPALTNMVAYTLARDDAHTYYVTDDGTVCTTLFPAGTMAGYTAALATYHNSVTSTWLGEAEDFGQLLGGQWTGTAAVEDVSGAHASYLGFSEDGSAWTYLTGLSHKQNARFARLKHEALTTATLRVTAPSQTIRLDAIPREEVGTGTSSASGPVTITLEKEYVAVKKLNITPEGTTARSATYDNVVVGDPTSFDVYIFNDAGIKIASAFRYEFQGV